MLEHEDALRRDWSLYFRQIPSKVRQLAKPSFGRRSQPLNTAGEAEHWAAEPASCCQSLAHAVG